MKPVSRRSVLGITAAMAAPAIGRYAHAAEITWRVGHVAPTSSPLHQRLLEAAEAIARRSDGRMELSIVGEGRAGIQSGLLAQVRDGRLEMTVASCRQLASTVPFCSIPMIGFLFAGYASLWPAMDGDLGQLIRSQIGSALNLVLPEKIWDFGFRDITTSTHAIKNAADIAAVKIVTQIDADEMDMFRALGAIPVVVPQQFIRTALEHRQIEGQEGMLLAVQAAGLDQFQGLCALTHHIWDGLWLCINAAAWKALPERLQNMVANTLDGAALHQRQDSANQAESIRASLTQAGMKFNEIDLGSFRDTLRRQGYYGRMREKFGRPTWQVVQQATGIAA